MDLSLQSLVDRDALAALPGMFLPRPGNTRHQVRGKRVLILLLVAALVGAGAAVTALVKGHHVMGTTSEVPWGILIATYVFFVASTSGLCLVSSLGHVFGFKVFEPVARRSLWLALVLLLVGFSVIGSELERPFLLAKLAILSPNPTSPIWWMGALYGLYTVIIAAELWFLFRKDHAKAKVAGVLGVVGAVAAHSNLGAVFGLAHARPYWFGPFLPLYLVSLSLVCGAALMILLVYFGDYFTNDRVVRPENEALVAALRKLLALFLCIFLVFTVWRVLTNVNGAHYHVYDVQMASLAGPLFVSFWFFEVILGVAVPLVIVLSSRGKTPAYAALAAALSMVGVFVMRLNFVYSGQMFSLKPVAGRMGETLRYTPPFKGNVAGFLHYTPSIVESLIVAGAISAAVLIFIAGLRVLRVARES